MAFNIFRHTGIISKGFTLVELLVVMAVLGVLAAGLIALINPADRVNLATDTKVIADMNQVIGATKAYAADNKGSYNATATTVNVWSNSAGAANLGPLLASQLSLVPNPITARGYTVNIPTGGASVLLYANIKSTKYANAANGAACTATQTYAFYTTNASAGNLCIFCGAAAPLANSACTANF